MRKPLIGISACLLGDAVRHDGGHKHYRYVTGELAQFFEFRPFCPEVASGLGVPRPALRLNMRDGAVRLQESQNPRHDHTQRLKRTALEACDTLGELSGYILKKDSPSCGMERVRVYSGSGMPEKNGRGLFAAQLLETFPQLPVEEEGRLSDLALRESFIERVFVYSRWQGLLREGLTPAGLMQFHARHKFSLLSRDESVYRELGPMVAGVCKTNLDSVAEAYIENLMQALKRPASRKRHCNVLMHLMGYFKTELSAEEKRELLQILEEYRLGMVPLVVPITLLKHYLRRLPNPYLLGQTYLDPYPREMRLRNAI